MLIILEGPDLAGKSTLAELLRRYLTAKYPRHNVRLLHRGPPTKHVLDEYVTPLLDYRPGMTEHIICDRWHVGEYVYPFISKRPSAMTPGVYRYVEAFLASRGALVVHVDAPDETLLRRYRERGDEVQSWRNVLAAAQEFRMMFEHHVRLPKIVDRPGQGRDLTPSFVCDRATYVESMVIPLRRLITYVGPPTPSVLFAGDVRACAGDPCVHKKPHSKFGTALMPYPATSGEFLMRALMGHNDSWGLVNVNDADDVKRLIDVVTQGVRIPVVALGRRAQRKLVDLKIPHTTVPHPQYVRRFHHRELAEYDRLLRLRDGKDHGSWRS